MKNDGVRLDVLLAVVLIVAIALRLTGLGRDIWVDEYSSISIAQASGFAALRGYDHPPLYFLLLRAWLWIGSADYVLRLLSVVFSVATVVAVLRWTRGYGIVASLVTGSLLATVPVAVRYGQEIRDYSLLMLLIAAAFACAARLTATPAGWGAYLRLGGILALAVATHFIAVFMVLSVLLYIVLDRRDVHRVEVGKLLLTAAVPAAVFCLLYFVVQSHVRERTAASWWMPFPSWPIWKGALQSLFGITPMGWLQNGWAASSRWYLRQFASALGLAPYIFSALLLLPGGRRSLPLLVAGFAYVAQVEVYSWFFVPIVVDRTLLPALIPWLGFAGVRLAELRWAWARWLGVAVVLLWSTAGAIIWTRSMAGFSPEPWRAVAALVEDSGAVRGRVLSVGWGTGAMSYYLRQPLQDGATLELPLNFPLPTMLDKVQRATADLEPGRAVALVAREVFIKPGSRQWFDTLVERLPELLGVPEPVSRFGPLSVRIYRKPADKGP